MVPSWGVVWRLVEKQEKSNKTTQEGLRIQRVGWVGPKGGIENHIKTPLFN